jgi:ABC-type oligopeptide transport system ATPase subunit
MATNEILMSATDLRKEYRRGGGAFAAGGEGNVFTAVDGVRFEIVAGETFAVVGESGCGKTTLARMLLRLIEPDGGKIIFAGRDFTALSGAELRAERRQLQMVFQDPYASLNPRMRVGEIVAEPLAIHEPALSSGERRERAAAMLRRVGLNEEFAARYPHEFSGGQRQRIGIARALILRPKLIVADEPVSALDVSVAAQMLVLLQELQAELGLTYLLISHSLPVVAQVATRMAVMRAGKFVELGEAEQVLRAPQHAYTRELLAAVPELPRVGVNAP